MIERNESLLLCDCGLRMVEVRKDKKLLAIDCRCGIRMTTQSEFRKMQRSQLEAQDGYEARQIRMLKRLEFNDAVTPYHRTKWVRPGFRRRLKVKKLFILAGIAFIIASLILLIV